VTNGSEKICQSIFWASAPPADEAAKIETMIQSILRIVGFSLGELIAPFLVSAH
jgi:hypothetical protein